MPSRERAELLLRKAAQDEFALAKLVSDPESPDELIGFHAQQAVEKMLKAVLAVKGVCYRPIHDLTELMELLRDNAISFPAGLEDSRRLTPFATTFRYDDFLLQEGEAFDRAWAIECVSKVRAWAESIIKPREERQ